VVSVQHSEKISLEDLRADVMTKVIRVVIPEKYLDDKTTFHINPCGVFVVGGPQVSGGFLDPFAAGVFYGWGFWVKLACADSHLPNFGNP
jgi:S-adenosylmethionine synthetase